MLQHQSSYHEQSTGAGVSDVFVDATGGTAVIDGCAFNSGTSTSVILGVAYSRLSNCSFASSPTDPTIIVAGPQCQLSNLHLNCGQAGPSIRFDYDATLGKNGSQGKLDDIFLYNSGRLDCSHPNITEVMLSNIRILAPSAAAGTYAIDLGPNHLDGALVTGSSAVCGGVRTTTGSVRNVDLNLGASAQDGITATNGVARLIGNRVLTVGGNEFVYASGNQAYGNSGFPSTVTGNNQTLNAERGTITVAPGTAAGGETLIALANSCGGVNSIVLASVESESVTAGIPYLRRAGVSSGGSALQFYIGNAHDMDAIAGDVKIHFLVMN